MAISKAERKNATIARLVDSAIVTIAEFGYADATAERIARRIGMSPGALFAHFSTMSEFMMQVAHEAMHRQSTLVKMTVSGGAKLSVTEITRALVSMASAPNSRVLNDLMSISRTNQRLHDAIGGTVPQYVEDTTELFRQSLAFDDWSIEDLKTLTLIVTDMTLGACLTRSFQESSEDAASKTALLAKLISRYSFHVNEDTS